MLNEFTWHLIAATTAEKLGSQAIAQQHRTTAKNIGGQQ